jgi:hypothetical protein
VPGVNLPVCDATDQVKLTVGHKAVARPLAHKAHAEDNEDAVPVAAGADHGLPSSRALGCNMLACFSCLAGFNKYSYTSRGRWQHGSLRTQA